MAVASNVPEVTTHVIEKTSQTAPLCETQPLLDRDTYRRECDCVPIATQNCELVDLFSLAAICHGSTLQSYRGIFLSRPEQKASPRVEKGKRRQPLLSSYNNACE